MSDDDGFNRQIDATLAFEGGYVNDPADPGGETKYGISKRSYPDTDIASLTIDQAKAIYHRDYWMKPGLSRLPAQIGAKVFDLGVNMGPKTAIRLLQASLNGLGVDPQLAEDGIVGVHTIIGAQALPADQVVGELRAQAAQHYRNTATLHPALQRFLRGWLRRAAA